MVSTEYKIAYSEILEILKYVSKEDLDKIPLDMIEMFKNNASNESIFKYDPNETLQEQNVSETARIIIAILFRDYWASQEQKAKIIAIQNSEREKIRQEKYSPDNLFKNLKRNQINEETMQTENVAMVEYKESLLKRLLNKVKRIFGK